MNSDSFSPTQLLDQLSINSLPYQDPLARIDWAYLNTDEFWLPEEALSLYGTAEFMSSPNELKIKLSHYEYLYLQEIHLWLENLFMGRLCEATQFQTRMLSLVKYHLHELREEAGHSLMFLELVHRSGLERVCVDFKQARAYERVRRKSPLGSLMFWSTTLIGEVLSDRMNRLILKQSDGVCSAVVETTKIHAMDQSRHITHSKNMVATLLKPLSSFQRMRYRHVLQRVLNQFVGLYYFPCAESYDLTGLMPGRSWAGLAWKNPLRHEFVRQQLQSTLRQFEDVGIQLKWRAK